MVLVRSFVVKGSLEVCLDIHIDNVCMNKSLNPAVHRILS